MKRAILSGVEKGFNLDQKGAVAELRQAVALAPDSPLPYSFLAVSYLFFYETSLDPGEKKANEEAMLKAVDECQPRAEKRIEKNSRDGEAYFSIALARMVKDRWEMVNKNYYRAFREAQSVWDNLEKAREINPDNYDTYYPMGIIHYYLAQLSGIARATASLFLTSADREKGLRELETAAEKGFFLKDMAESNLVSIYNGYERQPARALPLARKLRQKYPLNYNFAFGLADILSSLGHTKEAESVAAEIEQGIRSGAPPYRPELWPRYYQVLGRIRLDAGDYDRAMEYLQTAARDTTPYNARVRAWALVRIGMIYDVRRERKVAEEYYNRALKVEGAEGLVQQTAKEYLAKPYSPREKTAPAPETKIPAAK
ncbi:MAG TPA: hypothetical protein VLS90_19985 [Thermodesulfobacteriota bacterium]|nr:hypothetical protein [Thermodesulfobacteriota bacterium]